MEPAVAFWHVANFFAPALGVGAIAAALAKLVFRADYAGLAWWRLAGWSAGAAAAVLVAGLVVTGRDGRVATYAAMVAAVAAVLGWSARAR